MKKVFSFVLVLIMCLNLCACNEESSLHPFEGLYYQQTRDDVRSILGTPTSEEFEYVNVEYTWNVDEYDDIKFLGETGALRVWYDSDNLVTHAFWDCTLDFSSYVAYEIKMIDYFTSTYGDPQSDYFEYKWVLEGAEIGYTPEERTVGLTPDSVTIQLYWCGSYGQIATDDSNDKITQPAFSTDEIKEKLIGVWLAQTDYGGFGYIFWDDGTVLKRSLLGNTTLPDVKGTFEIMEDGKIKCENSSGSVMYLDYTFANNELCLFEDGVELDKD